MIVLLPPLFNDDLSFMAIGKDPTVKTFTAKGAVEALNEGILPRTAGGDVDRAALAVAQPLLKGVGNELRTIVTAKVVGCASQQE